MHPKYQEVIKLRLKGKSYREIAKIAGVSKNSVSRWCKNLKLPPAIKKIIEEKTKATRSYLVAYNKRRHRFVQLENKKIKETSANQIHLLSKYELRLVGAALYWAEGWRREIKGGSPYICFANSDPEMVVLFLRFLRENIQIPEEKLRPTIQVHPNIDAKSAIKFWSRITKIPKERFHITAQISRASKRKRPQNSLPHGTLRLDVSGRQNFFQIKGWINGLIQQT